MVTSSVAPAVLAPARTSSGMPSHEWAGSWCQTVAHKCSTLAASVLLHPHPAKSLGGWTVSSVEEAAPCCLGQESVSVGVKGSGAESLSSHHSCSCAGAPPTCLVGRCDHSFRKAPSCCCTTHRLHRSVRSWTGLHQASVASLAWPVRHGVRFGLGFSFTLGEDFPHDLCVLGLGLVS